MNRSDRFLKCPRCGNLRCLKRFAIVLFWVPPVMSALTFQLGAQEVFFVVFVASLFFGFLAGGRFGEYLVLKENVSSVGGVLISIFGFVVCPILTVEGCELVVGGCNL